jgi:serine/threonine protein phosphatase PrpC
VRFVLASDGFWDVVSVETVRCLGLKDSNKDPRQLAAQLAQKGKVFINISHHTNITVQLRISCK